MFAVTLTLLVVSLEVPRTFYELWVAVRDLPVFLVSFAMLMVAWRYHYLFFRRYGLGLIGVFGLLALPDGASVYHQRFTMLRPAPIASGRI